MQLTTQDQKIFNSGYEKAKDKYSLILEHILTNNQNQQYAFDQIKDYLYGKAKFSEAISHQLKLPCDNIVKVVDLLLKDVPNILKEKDYV